MLIGLLSDIHANLPALEACLAACERLGVTRLAFLGDLVGYGPDPEAVVQRVIPLVERGAIAVCGNHDEAAIRGNSGMNSAAARAIDWTRNQLSNQSKSFLSSLPFEVSSAHDLFVHSDASDPSAWHYVTDADSALPSLKGAGATRVFCGHVHVPALYCLSATGKVTAHRPSTDVTIPLTPNRKWLTVCGSVGQPRDSNPAAALATYDPATGALTFRRAAYDNGAVAQRILDAGLPESLAFRLLKGR